VHRDADAPPMILPSGVTAHEGEGQVVSHYPHVTRRRFLQGAGAVGASITLPGLISACGGSAAPSTHSTPAATQPMRGGTLRIGYVGNGSSETYNPTIAATPVDSLHCAAVFDPLLRPAPYYQAEPGLAVGWEHNADASVWEIKLRQGVTWHDGKPLTADDLIYSLRAFAAPTSFGAYAVQNVRLNELKKLDQHTVRVPLKTPLARLQNFFLYLNAAYVIQDGAKDFTKPIGTGPYKLESFVPGERSTLTANRDYWDSPRPYPDALEIIDIDDDTARLNALLADQIDICGELSYPLAKAGGNGQYRVLIGTGGNNVAFYMRVDRAPFTDVRVRQALKLIADRPALIEAAYSGIADVGNDVFGKGLSFYDTSLPQRSQDVEQAKSLLRSAGQSDLRITLNTSPVFAGLVEAATAFAQQAQAAGVTINVTRQNPASYLNPTVLYLKESFAQTFWPVASLDSWYAQALAADADENETHWSSAQTNALYSRAVRTADTAASQAIWNQLQAQQYNQGGYIMWGIPHNADALSHRVAGVGDAGSGWLYPTDDQRVWNWGLTST
jgi:peptide/nickel transport system substrate-binding protein